MKIGTYNPKKVTCAFGSHIVDGYAEDSFISVELGGDGTTTVVGADGEIVRSIDPSDMYTIKLTLLQTSPTNNFLYKQYERDKATSDGFFPVIIKDLLGGDKFACDMAWVAKPAPFNRNKASTSREWEITCGKGQYNMD